MSISTSSVDVEKLVHKYYPSHEKLDAHDAVQVSQSIYPSAHYSNEEKTEISHWITTAAHLTVPGEDVAIHTERLASLNTQLATRTTVLGSKPSVADAALFSALASMVARWTPEERTGKGGYHHIVRYVDFVQHAALVGLELQQKDRISVDVSEVIFVQKPLDPKEEKERKKKAMELAAKAEGTTLTTGRTKEQSSETSMIEPNSTSAPKDSTTATPDESNASSKKEKKEKKPKIAKAAIVPPTESALSPALIDLRVGHILQATAHPNADALYVSTIACGDLPGTPNTSQHSDGQTVRTVCSGLRGRVALEDLQGRHVVVVCNLKPVTMRGIVSAAMVLAASPGTHTSAPSDPHTELVELVDPPAGAEAGARVFVEGWQGEPAAVLAPKKKVWETLQPGFGTTEERAVVWDVRRVEPALREGAEITEVAGRLVVEGRGACSVKSLKGGVVR